MGHITAPCKFWIHMQKKRHIHLFSKNMNIICICLARPTNPYFIFKEILKIFLNQSAQVGLVIWYQSSASYWLFICTYFPKFIILALNLQKGTLVHYLFTVEINVEAPQEPVLYRADGIYWIHYFPWRK